MTDADIRPLLAAEPFEPFTLNLTGRTSYDIDRPEWVGFSASGGALYLRGPDGQVRVVLALEHVVSISYPAQPFIR